VDIQQLPETQASPAAPPLRSRDGRRELDKEIRPRLRPHPVHNPVQSAAEAGPARLFVLKDHLSSAAADRELPEALEVVLSGREALFLQHEHPT